MGSYSRQNSLATALREIGRIEKTIFILNYISDELLRRKIQRDLNKRRGTECISTCDFLWKTRGVSITNVVGLITTC